MGGMDGSFLGLELQIKSEKYKWMIFLLISIWPQ